jgi:hypothetical protein
MVHSSRWLLTAGLLLLLAGRSEAFDAGSVDILTLRLGQSEDEVVARLADQGIGEARMQRQRHACPRNPAVICLAAIQARTRDGMLTITFGDATTGTASDVVFVHRIEYRLSGKGAGEPDMIRASVLNRFGEPSWRQPLAWCGRAARATGCPADQPRLTFEAGPGVSSLLTLTAGDRRTSGAR